MKIISYNVNGIRAAINKGFIDWLRESNIDVILFEKPQVSKVGSYALKFEFPQGCNSGIFTFERLYKLCKNENPDDGKPYVHGAW